MENKILDWQKRLIKLTEKHIILSEGHCKPAEPCIQIGIGNDLKWFAEIYSYLMEFHDGGRHHSFEGDTWEQLSKKIEEGIKKEEAEVKPR